MEMLSEDQRNIRNMTPEELDLAWDLWFDLAQATNEDDPPYSHGVLVGIEKTDLWRELAERLELASAPPVHRTHTEPPDPHDSCGTTTT